MGFAAVGAVLAGASAISARNAGKEQAAAVRDNARRQAEEAQQQARASAIAAQQAAAVDAQAAERERLQEQANAETKAPEVDVGPNADTVRRRRVRASFTEGQGSVGGSGSVRI